MKCQCLSNSLDILATVINTFITHSTSLIGSKIVNKHYKTIIDSSQKNIIIAKP